MNEVTELVLLYHMQMFTSWVHGPETRYEMGWSFIAVIVLYIGAHLTIMMLGTFGRIRSRCKRAKNKRRMKQLIKKREEMKRRAKLFEMRLPRSRQ